MAGVDDYGFPLDWADAENPAFVSGGGGAGMWDTTKDVVGTLLGAYSTLESQKLNARLAETELQAKLWGIPTKYQNPQATAQGYTAGGAFLPSGVLLALAVAAGAFLLWKVAK